MEIGSVFVLCTGCICCRMKAAWDEHEERRRRMSRLMITSITVDNFKSYIGRQQIGPFHQNFTVILAPNGGGKSNVIDALRFVLGHGTSEIQCESISNLIHSSTGRENLQSCSVSVKFQKIVDKRNGFRVMRGSSFVVSRTAYRDNSSNYNYNGKTINFNDLDTKLRQVGLNLTHRFLIHQGEVERIALMKPKAQVNGEMGMLEYLDDIIGSNRLTIQIERLHDFIEKLQEERSAQLNRVKAAEKEMNELKGSVKDYLDYLKLKNKITHVWNKIHQLNKHKIVVQRNELQQMTDEYEGRLDRVTKKLNKVLMEQNAKKEQQNKLQKDCDEAPGNEAEKKERCTEMESGEEKQSLQWKTRWEADVEAGQEKNKEYEETLEEAQRTVEEFREVIANAEKTIKEIIKDAIIATFEAETDDAKERKRVLERELDELAMAETQASNDLSIAQDEQQMIGVDEDKERRQSDEIRLLKDAAEFGLRENRTDLEMARRPLARVGTELSARRSELEQLKVGGAQVEVDMTEEMAAVERELEQDESLLEQNRTERHQLTVTELEIDFEKTTDSIKNLSTQITDGGKRLTALNKCFTDQEKLLNAVKVDEKARAIFQERVEKCTELRDAAAATAQEQREKLETVAAEIQAIWDRLFGPFQKAIDAATATKADGEKTITKEQSVANAAEGHLEEAQTNLQDYEADLKEGNEQIAPLVTNIEQLTTEGQSVLDAMRDAQHDAQQESMNKERLSKEESKKNTELSGTVSGLQCEKDEWQSKWEKLKEALGAQIKEIDKSISNLKLHGDLDCILSVIGGHPATEEHVDFLDETKDHTSILNVASSSKESDRTSAPLNNQSDNEEGAHNPNEAEQLKIYNAHEIADWNVKAMHRERDELRREKCIHKGESLKQKMIENYAQKADEWKRLFTELKAISFDQNQQQKLLNGLKKERLEEFLKEYPKIRSDVKETYQVTTGGTASLNLIDRSDPFSGGIRFNVRPPKKSWKQIANLSGGEKTLSSLALVFAVRAYKSIPLYVVDEIDASLDFCNVSHYFNNFAKNVQFIFISLPDNASRLGGRQVGINRAHDSTYNVIIDPGVGENERPADTAHTSQNSAVSQANVANV